MIVGDLKVTKLNLKVKKKKSLFLPGKLTNFPFGKTKKTWSFFFRLKIQNIEFPFLISKNYFIYEKNVRTILAWNSVLLYQIIENSSKNEKRIMHLYSSQIARGAREGGVFSLPKMRFGLLYVFWIAKHENQGLFREIFSEHPQICKKYPQRPKGVFLMY